MAILHILPMKSAIFHGTQCITTVSWRRLEVALLPAHCADGTHGLQRVEIDGGYPQEHHDSYHKWI